MPPRTALPPLPDSLTLEELFTEAQRAQAEHRAAYLDPRYLAQLVVGARMLEQLVDRPGSA